MLLHLSSGIRKAPACVLCVLLIFSCDPQQSIIGLSSISTLIIWPKNTIFGGKRRKDGSMMSSVRKRALFIVGGTGIGYFVWNEWNNLSIVNVIVAILMIGLIGMILDQLLAAAARLVTFPE